MYILFCSYFQYFITKLFLLPQLLDERRSSNVFRFLQSINGYFLHYKFRFNFKSFVVADLMIFMNRRHDITDGLKNLNCRTLIFVGESSPFHSEALHMTSKLDKRYCALVEVCNKFE